MGLQRKLGYITEPHILFPAVAVLVLALIWGATFYLIAVERTTAEHGAAVSGFELAETYEAQIVRAVREIDQTLNFVKYAFELRSKDGVLAELRARALLPPELLFVVALADSTGTIVASTRPPESSNVAGQDFFRVQREGDARLAIGRPVRQSGTGEWQLQFSRRLSGADGSFSGIVMITVDAAYFVSGYETAKLGEHGVLGILGTDGVFRARRSGERLSAGDSVNYAKLVLPADDRESEAALATNEWDGVPRYTSARQLYDLPLAVVVGLSAEEQLAAMRRHMRTTLWWASGASLLLLVIVGMLGILSHQLAATRRVAVEDQLAHAARVEYLAYHDGLTTLPNRSLFNKLLGQSITESHRHGRQLAVLFLDLDRFKHINDTLGHEAGDELLQEVAARLRQCLRDSDLVARLGGDEFVALLPEINDETRAAAVARKILAAIARPFVLLGHEFRVTASIGISIYPKDGLDEQTLTKNADIAMYKAKEEGKNNFQFYSESLNANSLERLTLESGLRHALEAGEFHLDYQAKRDLCTNRITGVEALLRWRHPDLGTMAPMRFIHVAEETGLIVPIGKWVLRTACQQNMAWQAQGLQHLSMAVNLTARQFFDEHLVDDLRGILAATKMSPNLLELEISETLLMRDIEKTLRILTALKSMGIRIALDDFGIGYALLSTLQQFPIDTIKIDQSFIRDISTNTADEDLTGAIIAMGRKLSLTVVAQGVETREQADLLRQHACDEIQGFYFNRPLPPDEIAGLLPEARCRRTAGERDAGIAPGRASSRFTTPGGSGRDSA